MYLKKVILLPSPKELVAWMNFEFDLKRMLKTVSYADFPFWLPATNSPVSQLPLQIGAVPDQ